MSPENRKQQSAAKSVDAQLSIAESAAGDDLAARPALTPQKGKDVAWVPPGPGASRYRSS